MSNALNQPETVPEATRAKVQAGVGELGYIRGAPTAELAPHWRRSGFATWLFHPASTERYPNAPPSRADMRRRLLEDLTRLWEEALAARWTKFPGSPVAVLDRLLKAYATTR